MQKVNVPVKVLVFSLGVQHSTGVLKASYAV